VALAARLAWKRLKTITNGQEKQATTRENMARARSDAAAVESMAATGAGHRRREDAWPGRPGTPQRLSVHEGTVVVLTIGGTTVHAKIVKMEQSSMVGSSKKRRSAERNTREAYETRQRRRASAAQAMAGSVPPGLGLEQQQVQEEVQQGQFQEQEQKEPPNMMEETQVEMRAEKRAAASVEASAPAQRRQRVREAQSFDEVAGAAVPRVVCGRAPCRARAVEVTPAGKVARRGRWDDAASASVAARERRRQGARDAKSDDGERARLSGVVYVFT
jgi:hypothetical protein